MTTNEVRAKLVTALTEYDRKQAKRRGYNPYALGIYFERLTDVVADMGRGATARQALCAGFNDRLLDYCLRSIGEAPFKPEELGNSVYYTPAKA